jgi:putative phosphoribosyl transferase
MNAPYRDRTEAGKLLAIHVAPLVTGPTVVVGIPRGGVVVAAPIADRLGAPLTLVHVRKISLAKAPELAVGAMDEDGQMIVQEGVEKWLQATVEDLATAERRVRAEIERQRRRYDSTPLARLAEGATVVLVDDGLATGATMVAAVAYSKRHGAARVVVAVPCASSTAADRFRREADLFVCPWVDPEFGAVGFYYEGFSPVRDRDVVKLLDRARDTGEGRRWEVFAS